jgi:hypothetical protein
MAAIRVLISQRDSHKVLADWWEEDSSPSRQENWERAASLWPEKCLVDQPDPVAVYLRVAGESSPEGYEESFVRGVVERARIATWGAKVYLVVDHEAGQLIPAVGGGRPARPRWLETLHESGVSDILQWPMQGVSTYAEAAARSEARMRKLISDVPNRSWKCVIHTPPHLGPEQESFLAPYLASSLKKLEDENCLLVLQGKRENHMRFVRRALRQRPDYRVIIGVIDQIEEPPRELKEFCHDEGYELVRFHGLVELYYFLRRLNSINETETTPVPVVREPVFRSHAPQLLITHSYTARDKSGCLTAAHDTWELTKDLRGAAKVKIYPAVKCVKLADILDELQQVLVWVHIGHGDDLRGLQEADDELFKSAEDWLNSFAGYKSSLALAMFSSCRSASVAKHFAESGVGVSIGFAQDVHKKACVHLTKRVVKAALESNGSRTAILEAFREGRKVLGTADPHALPVAFWASH